MVRRLLGGLAAEKARAAELEEKNKQLEWEKRRDRRLKTMLHGDAMVEHLETLIEGDDAVAIGVIDLSNFKLTNDFWGHEVGHKLLRYLEEHLNAHLRREGERVSPITFNETEYAPVVDELGAIGEDSIGRMGGDEFAIVLTINLGSGEPQEIEQRAQTIEEKLSRFADYMRLIEEQWLGDEERGVRKLLNESSLLEGQTLSDEQRAAVIAGIGFSMGLSVYDAAQSGLDERTPKEIVDVLLKKADEGMYVDKKQRRQKLEEAHPAIIGLSARK